MTFAILYNMTDEATKIQKQEILDFSLTMKSEGKTDDVRYVPDTLTFDPIIIANNIYRMRTFIDQAAVNEWTAYSVPRGVQNLTVYQQTA